jgi:hypothetical protein
MRQVASNLWVREQRQRFFAFELGTRMTVIRLSDGGLFLHSPVRLDAELGCELDALGRVEFVVAPNKLHHLYVADYFARYPQARIYAAPGLERKRPDLLFHGVLDGSSAAPWSDQIAALFFPAESILNEIVFLHHASGTLLLTDIAFNIQRTDSTATRIFFQLDGGYRRFGPTRLMKALMLRHRRAGREAVKRILEWNYDRIIVTHGDIVETGGRKAIRDAFAFL